MKDIIGSYCQCHFKLLNSLFLTSIESVLFTYIEHLLWFISATNSDDKRILRPLKAYWTTTNLKLHRNEKSVDTQSVVYILLKILQKSFYVHENHFCFEHIFYSKKIVSFLNNNFHLSLGITEKELQQKIKNNDPNTFHTSNTLKRNLGKCAKIFHVS